MSRQAQCARFCRHCAPRRILRAWWLASATQSLCHGLEANRLEAGPGGPSVGNQRAPNIQLGTSDLARE